MVSASGGELGLGGWELCVLHCTYAREERGARKRGGRGETWRERGREEGREGEREGNWGGLRMQRGRIGWREEVATERAESESGYWRMNEGTGEGAAEA